MAKKQSFEDALQKLEEITRELERGDVDLEITLKKFDEGMQLADFCSKKLDAAQQKVNILLNKNGVISSSPLDEPPA